MPDISLPPADQNQAEKLIAAVFSDHAALQAAVEKLVANGVPRDKISVILAEDTKGAPLATGVRQTETRSNEGLGAAIGALLGGAAMIGALAVMGPLAIVAGASLGGMMGGVVSSLRGAGATEDYARRLDAALQEHGGLIMLHVSRLDTDRARQQLAAVGGQFIEEAN